MEGRRGAEGQWGSSTTDGDYGIWGSLDLELLRKVALHQQARKEQQIPVGAGSRPGSSMVSPVLPRPSTPPHNREQSGGLAWPPHIPRPRRVVLKGTPRESYRDWEQRLGLDPVSSTTESPVSGKSSAPKEPGKGLAEPNRPRMSKTRALELLKQIREDWPNLEETEGPEQKEEPEMWVSVSMPIAPLRHQSRAGQRDLKPYYRNRASATDF